jgi:transportin-3
MAFQALRSDDLFDIASDVICEIIKEADRTAQQFVDDIYQNLCSLHDLLVGAQAEEHSDKQRNLCRIFVEAGETLLTALLKAHERYRFLVDGILVCTSYTDLDVVPMTFNFWFELTRALMLEENVAIRTFFMYAYSALTDIMIGHLRYPTEEISLEERDQFRDFRHVMVWTILSKRRIHPRATFSRIASWCWDRVKLC